MIKHTLLAAAAALALSTAAHAANGDVVVNITPPPSNLNFFAGQTNNTPLGNKTLDGINFSGQGEIVSGNAPTHIAPFNTSYQYMTLSAGQSETLTFLAPTNEINFAWGSPDPQPSESPSLSNLVWITTTDGETDLFNGAQIGEGLGGAPVYANAFVQMFDLTGNGTAQYFQSVTFSTTVTGFEFAFPVDPPTGSAPEASTWAMMMVGFAGLGYAGYRKTRGQRLATFA